MQNVREVSRIRDTGTVVSQLQDVGTKTMMKRAYLPAVAYEANNGSLYVGEIKCSDTLNNAATIS